GIRLAAGGGVRLVAVDVRISEERREVGHDDARGWVEAGELHLAKVRPATARHDVRSTAQHALGATQMDAHVVECRSDAKELVAVLPAPEEAADVEGRRRH